MWCLYSEQLPCHHNITMLQSWFHVPPIIFLCFSYHNSSLDWDPSLRNQLFLPKQNVACTSCFPWHITFPLCLSVFSQNKRQVIFILHYSIIYIILTLNIPQYLQLAHTIMQWAHSANICTQLDGLLWAWWWIFWLQSNFLTKRITVNLWTCGTNGCHFHFTKYKSRSCPEHLKVHHPERINTFNIWNDVF